MEELDIFVGTLKKKAEVNPKDIAAAKRKERKEKARQNPTKKTRRRKTKSQLRKERGKSRLNILNKLPRK